MSAPPPYDRNGPPGGLPGSQEWANEYNKAAQARQQEISDRKQAALEKAANQVSPKEQFQPAASEITKQAQRG